MSLQLHMAGETFTNLSIQIEKKKNHFQMSEFERRVFPLRKENGERKD